MKTFVDKLMDAIDEKKSILCVGLDPQFKLIPAHTREGNKMSYGRTFEAVGRTYLEFNQQLIDAVESLAVTVKPQMAFYEKYGHWGVWAFEETVKYAKKKGLIVIEDAKREDGGATAHAYADGHLGKVDFWGKDKQSFSQAPSLDLDCMTVTTWIGEPMIKPFIEVVKEYGKGVFVVDKTSFQPASEIQEWRIAGGRRNWEELAKLVRQWSEGTEGERGYRNIGVVMGATFPEEATVMREILPECFFLIPGYGAQGGGADGAVKGANKDGYGAIVNSSRGINYAYSKEQFKCDPEKFAEAAAKAAEFARDDINAALKRAGKLPW